MAHNSQPLNWVEGWGPGSKGGIFINLAFNAILFITLVSIGDDVMPGGTIAEA